MPSFNQKAGISRRDLVLTGIGAAAFPAAAQPTGGFPARGKARFIYEQAPFPSCHASTIVETKPGELLAAWFGGQDEGHPSVAIWGAFRRANSTSWTEPFEMQRESKIACYNPVLFHSRDGVLWLWYRFGPNPSEWSSARRHSRDGGKTWSAVEYLPAGILGPIKNKPLVLPDGAIVAGSSMESYQAWTSYVEISRDHGVTWTRSAPILYPGVRHGTIQPSIVTLKGGLLRMYVRTTPKIGKVAYADSRDQGRTWTELKPLDLPNPNSGLDAVGLKDGRIVLIYNHTSKGRSPLSLAVSRDGLDFQRFSDLESEPGEYSYPAIIQTADGSLHATYTWKRSRIKHLELGLGEIP